MPKKTRALTVGGEGSDIVSVETKKLKLGKTYTDALRNLAAFDWMLFTSKNAVNFFIEELARRGIRFPKSVKIAAVGPQTARALEFAGVKIHLVPKKFSGGHLVEALDEKMKGRMKDAKIIFPRSAIAPPEILSLLRNHGAKVTAIPLYTTIPARIKPAVISRIENGGFDYLVFMSPSGIHGLMKNIAGKKTCSAAKKVPAICIGPRTAHAARALKFKKIHVAETYSRVGIARLLRKLP